MINEKKTSFFYIQEILASYRKPLIDKLVDEYDLTILSGTPGKDTGFKAVKVDSLCLMNSSCVYFFNRKIFFQKDVIKNILLKKPEIILTSASTRNITYWMVLLLCKLLGIKVFSHGQGLYSKPNPSFIIKLSYKLISLMTYKYICYTYISRDVMIDLGFNSDKLFVAENSISLATDASNIDKSGEENGVLYIGRLRERCELEKLISTIELLRKKNENMILHIVGSGQKEAYFRQKYNFDWIVFYGAVYDDARIVEISKDCRYGCYPGDVGLSVVHFFSLKLPPIIHKTMIEHGPEACYVIDGVNGLTFDKEHGFESMYSVLDEAWRLPKNKYIELSQNAYSEYQRLNSPPLESRIIDILKSS